MSTYVGGLPSILKSSTVSRADCEVNDLTVNGALTNADGDAITFEHGAIVLASNALGSEAGGYVIFDTAECYYWRTNTGVVGDDVVHVWCRVTWSSVSGAMSGAIRLIINDLPATTSNCDVSANIGVCTGFINAFNYDNITAQLLSVSGGGDGTFCHFYSQSGNTLGCISSQITDLASAGELVISYNYPC